MSKTDNVNLFKVTDLMAATIVADTPPALLVDPGFISGMLAAMFLRHDSVAKMLAAMDESYGHTKQ